MSPIMGRAVTIKTTRTDGLEGLVFYIKGIAPHPDNPETRLTLGRKP
jgi:hypothetical protein